MDVAITATIVMVVALVIILLMGAPIAVAIGMSSAMAMVVILPTNVALVTCAQKMFTGLNSFPLLAIPFFVLAGNLMNNGGIAIRIIRLAEACVEDFQVLLRKVMFLRTCSLELSVEVEMLQQQPWVEQSGQSRLKGDIQRNSQRQLTLHQHLQEC